MCRPGEDPFAGVCISAEEYNRAVALEVQRAAMERERLGLAPEPEEVARRICCGGGP